MFSGELRKQKALFATADGAALLAAFVCALSIHDPSGAMENRLLATDLPQLGLAVVVVAALWIGVFRTCGLYRMRNGGLKESFAIVKGCSIAALLTLVAGFMAQVDVSRLTVVLGYLLSMPLVVVFRALMRAALRRLYANPKIAIPLLIIGFNQVGRYLLDQIIDEMAPYEPVGFLDAEAVGRQYRGYPVIGRIERLREFRSLCPGLETAIAMPEAPRKHLEEIIELCETCRVRWWMVPWMLRPLVTGLEVDMLGVVPLIGPRCSNIEGINFAIKRCFDVTAGLLLLLPSAPVIALGALAVWLSDGRPVFFRQMRVGAHGKLFELFKLRTMRIAAGDQAHRDYVSQWIQNGHGAANSVGANGHPVFKLAHDNRVTRVGRVLRRFSIDELPQLINVVRGEMSLIGPRPALPYELDLYQEWHRRRLDAMPGITGLWQVSGRNRLSFEEMVRLDVQYLEDWSLKGDLKILARTVAVLLRGEGV